jgi:hypothetical protein
MLRSCLNIFYRHNHSRDKSSLDRIDFCIVETATFPEGVFLPDMDLIMPIDRSTKTCETWRISGGRSTATFAGSFHFGKYRSQGALRIEDECQIISAQAFIDQRLFLLQPEFKSPMEKRGPTWANEVVRLREAFLPEQGRQTTNDEGKKCKQ